MQETNAIYVMRKHEHDLVSSTIEATYCLEGHSYPTATGTGAPHPRTHSHTYAHFVKEKMKCSSSVLSFLAE